jgi:hypothetical protein
MEQAEIALRAVENKRENWWLGRQDSNLGMAEIKIPQFGLFRTPGGRRSMTRCGQRRRKGGRHQSGSGIEASIILGSVDAQEEAKAIRTAAQQGIKIVGILPVRLRILGHRIILLCGWLADPFGDAVGDEIARMLKRDNVRAAPRRFFIADRQHRAAAW